MIVCNTRGYSGSQIIDRINNKAFNGFAYPYGYFSPLSSVMAIYEFDTVMLALNLIIVSGVFNLFDGSISLFL